MNAVAVIPSRWGSTRFPGKPLATIVSRPMIAWVVEACQAAKKVNRVIVATDDERIAEAAREAGAEARMTSQDCATGTDRVAEAVQGVSADVIVNVQGDEPILDPTSLDTLIDGFADPSVRMATLGVRGVTAEERENPAVVKIVLDDSGDALYFSRAAIPHRSSQHGVQDVEVDEHALRHVGIYAFRPEALQAFVAEPRQGLEVQEDLEQLRALRLGWKVRVFETRHSPICVDTPADIERVEALIHKRGEGVLR